MEIEFKLSCTPSTAQALERLLTRLTGAAAHTLDLKNTYYDTPEQALRQHGIALRIRQQGELTLQTVKCAGQVSGGLSSRPEWETPYTGAFDFSPVDDANTRKQLETLARKPGFQATLDTDFSRHVWTWQPDAETCIELMLDRGDIAAGGKHAAICELELELVRGDAQRLLELVSHLGRLVPLFPAPLSKATRGSLLLSGREPDMPAHNSTAPHCGDAFAELAQACLDLISLHLPANRPDFNSHDLHQVRVGLRHLRALLELFLPQLHRHWGHKQLLQGAKTHMQALAPARTLHSITASLLAPAMGAPQMEGKLQGLHRRLIGMQDQAHAAAQRYLLGPAFADWLLQTSLALHTQPLRKSAAGKAWPDKAKRQIKKQLQTYAHLLKCTDMQPQTLHCLRKAGKHLRYQLVATGLSGTRTGKPLCHQLEQVQATLGQLNDLYSAGPLLNPLPPSLLPAVRLLGADRASHHAALLAKLPSQMQALQRAIQRQQKTLVKDTQ